MKKLCLTLVGLYIGYFAGFAQDKTDSSKYKNHTLSFEEANIVSSYYQQTGNNSAVTGGIGTEKLTDLSNSFDVKLYRYDNQFRKHTWGFELGIDHYTSASSDMIDLKANSSASHADTRVYPSITWTRENEKKGITIGGGASYSHEFDYQSFGLNLNFAKKTNDKSGEFTAKIQAYLDQVKLVYPIELRTGNSNSRHIDYASTPRNSFSATAGWSQIINQHLQVSAEADVIAQQGYLGLPFHRVIFNDNSTHVETLPSNRLKIPIGLRANYFLGDRIILRAYYRYYTDSWGIHANTASLEIPVKITAFVSISPFYRYYIQTAVKYFAGYQVHTAADEFYTSNYDLSSFNSNFFGAGIRLTPPKGVFGFEHLNMLELRYGHYAKNTGMQSNIISLNLKFK